MNQEGDITNNLNFRKFIYTIYPVYMNILCDNDNNNINNQPLHSQSLRKALLSSFDTTESTLFLEKSIHICEVFCLHSEQTENQNFLNNTSRQ
jgi:uncharacterized pyridoxamine 5'-phosphate oxidase family protein